MHAIWNFVWDFLKFFPFCLAGVWLGFYLRKRQGKRDAVETLTAKGFKNIQILAHQENRPYSLQERLWGRPPCFEVSYADDHGRMKTALFRINRWYIEWFDQDKELWSKKFWY